MNTYVFMFKILLVVSSTISVGIVQASQASDDTELAAAAPQPWVKRGVLIAPGFAGPRSDSRISAPSLVKLKNGRLRMYFWTMGGEAEHHYIFAAEASPQNPFQWELISTEPMLGPDPNGNIRDGGPSFPWVVPRDNGPWLMYYGAWGSWAPEGELSNRTGLALSYDEGLTWTVEKETVLPLGQPGSHDAGLTGSVDVLQTGKNEYMMWYTAGERYQWVGQVYRGIVHVGMARSEDGIEWIKYEKPALSPRLEAVQPFEAVVSKPSVLVIDNVYHMWLSIFNMEGKGYRLGYAKSENGIHWHRYIDKQVLSLTPGGFDSEYQSYPNVVDMGDQLWMFYTGNASIRNTSPIPT